MTVLEFGAGSGWLSRFLTQMGCRVDAARRLADSAPHGARALPSPARNRRAAGTGSSSSSTGAGSQLPDASVDRIICFDAFHHAPNPGEVVAEFARVLAAGRAWPDSSSQARAMRRPHGRSSKSHTYGVVERDVDVHEILARGACERLRATFGCASFTRRRITCRSREYEDLLAGGQTGAGWLASTRTFLRHVRSFYLVKGGLGRADSRSPSGLACEIRAALADARRGGQPIVDRRDHHQYRHRRHGLRGARRAEGSALARIYTTSRVRSSSFDFHVEALTTRRASRARGNRELPGDVTAARRRSLSPRARLRRLPRHLVRSGRIATGGSWTSRRLTRRLARTTRIKFRRCRHMRREAALSGIRLTQGFVASSQ